MNREQLDNVIDIVNREVTSLGYECIEAEWESGERVLRVYIDNHKPDGVLINDCLAANAALKDLVELDDMVEGTYHLEVSSPGIERPLRLAQHFLDNVGKTIRVKLKYGAAQRIKGIGKLVAVSADGIVTMKWPNGEDWTFPLRELKKANIVYDWDHKN